MPALVDFIESTDFCTSLKQGCLAVRTVEHLMSALHAYRITNVLIKISDEVPIMDGSADAFCRLIEEARIAEQDAVVEEFIVDRCYAVGQVRADAKFILVEPYDGFRVTYRLDYPPPLGVQEFSYEHKDSTSYRHQIAPARTFAFVKEVELQPAPAAPVLPNWEYGVGEIDEAGILKSFVKFHHYTGEAWQGSEFHPDPTLGSAQLKAETGHPGDDNKHAVVRRWIAPSNCVVRISGTLSHEGKEGDGIRAYVLVGSNPAIASWTLRTQKAETVIEDVSVRGGESIDFVVACGKDSSNDTFKWAPRVGSWDAKANFAGPSEPPLKPLNAWAAFAQVLLFSNEFMFID